MPPLTLLVMPSSPLLRFHGSYYLPPRQEQEQCPGRVPDFHRSHDFASPTVASPHSLYATDSFYGLPTFPPPPQHAGLRLLLSSGVGQHSQQQLQYPPGVLLVGVVGWGHNERKRERGSMET